MRKLSWFLIATALASYAVYLWTTADPTAIYVLRDGLILAMFAVGIMAWQAPSRPSSAVSTAQLNILGNQPPVIQTVITTWGALFVGTGALCTLVGTLLPYLLSTPITDQSAASLRWLGWAMVLFVLIWPRAWQSRRYAGTSALLAEESAASKQQQPLPTAFPWLPLLFLLLVGLGLRLLLQSRLPGTCIGAECETALALNGTVASSVDAAPLLQLIFRITGESLRAVRWGALLIALAIPLFFYLAIRRLTNNGVALLGGLMLTLTPWFATLSGSNLSTLMALFWSCGGLWLLLEGYARQDLRWALLAGLVLGLIQGNLLLPLTLFAWLLLLALFTLFVPRALAAVERPAVPSQTAASLLTVIAFLSAALPAFVREVTSQPATFGGILSTAAANAFTGNSFLYALFQQGIAIDGYWQHVPPLVMPVGVLTLLGCGLAVRHFYRLPYFLLGSGTLFMGLLFFYTGSVTTLALFFLLLIFTATLALAALFGLFAQQWQPLLPYANAVALAALLLALLAVRPLWTNLERGQSGRSREALAVEERMIEQIATLHANAPDRVIFAPASLLQNPSARLRLGDDTLALLRPLSDLLNALYTTDGTGTTTYFIPVTAQPYLELLQRMQPSASVSQQIDPASGEWLFSEVTIQQADLLAQQGLLGVAWANDTNGSSAPVMLPNLGPLQFSPNNLALTPPYTIQWSGSLRVATPGNYRIVLDPSFGGEQWFSPGPAAPILTLQLDNRLILDTSLGVVNQELSLAKGFYQLALQLRMPEAATTDEQADAGETIPVIPFAIRWQRPDGSAEIIPRAVLTNVPLPNFGLIGAYYWGESTNGEPFDRRKDLLVGAMAERNEAYTIRWTGQLAAPRSGEYLLATLSAPGSITQLAVDGIPIVDTALMASESPEPAPSTTNPAANTRYGEGTIYLAHGWHAIEITHRPDAALSPLQLFWQPPGSAPTVLDANYFAPSVTPLAEIDRGLPSAPLLVNGGDERGFALSYGTEFWQPQRQIPPGYLPQLALEPQWQIGRCGSDEAELDQPHGVAISGIRGLIYVVDTANQRVIEYALSGAVNQIYRSPEWQEPFAVALLDDGFPVVLDATTQLLYDLNPATGAVTPRPQRASFYRPRGLAVDNAGNLLIADTGGGRVVLLSPGGDEVRAFGGPDTQIGRGQPTGVAGAGGTLWAVTPEDGRLWNLENGGSITAIERTNTLNGPHLAALPTGQLFLSDPTRRMVLYLAANGEPLAQVTMGNFGAPTGVAVATVADRLYLAVADSANCALGLWSIPVAALPQSTP